MFDGHTNRVVGIAIDDGSLYSASHDHTIRKWDLRSQTTAPVVFQHQDKVTCFHIHKERLYSGTIHKEINCFDKLVLTRRKMASIY